MKSDTRNRLLLPLLLPLGVLAIIAVVLFAFSRILLSIKPNAATAVAVIVAATILGAAAYAASRPRVRNATLGMMLGIVGGVAMLSGGLAIVAIGPEKPAPKPFAATIAAPSGAAQTGFSQTSLAFPADKPVLLVFQNDDPQIQHNVVIFDGKDANAPTIFRGAPVTGLGNVPYALKPFATGSYFFHCEFHPTTMTGTITVTAGGGAPPTSSASSTPSPSATSSASASGGGGTATATIQAIPTIKFSTSQMSLPAGKTVTVTLENNDPGQTHDFSVYADSGYTQSLGKTELITGPGTTASVDLGPLDLGTYYFRCDVHPPQMFGTITVG